MTHTDVTRRNRRLILPILILFTLSLTGCRDHDTPPPADRSAFEFVVVSDIHVRVPGNPDDGYYDNQANLANALLAVDLINELYTNADFVAVSGDLVGCLFSETIHDHPIDVSNPAIEFRNLFDHLNLPYYVLLGNHDYHTGFDPVILEHIPAADPEAVELVWKTLLGIDPFYSFIHKGIQMIFLNSNRGVTQMLPCSGLETETLCMGSFDTAQLNWLEACLNRPEPAVIFCHHPPAEMEEPQDRPFWISMLSEIMVIDPLDPFYGIIERHQKNILAIFSGHWHLWHEYLLFGTIPVYLTGSVGDMLGSGENISVVRIDPVLETIEVSRHSEAVSD